MASKDHYETRVKPVIVKLIAELNNTGIEDEEEGVLLDDLKFHLLDTLRYLRRYGKLSMLDD